MTREKDTHFKLKIKHSTTLIVPKVASHLLKETSSTHIIIATSINICIRNVGELLKSDFKLTKIKIKILFKA